MVTERLAGEVLTTRPRAVGYTLLELLASLAIVAAIAALATSFTPLIARERSIQAVIDLRSMLNFARYSAIVEQQHVTVCALNEESRCVREWQDRDYAIFIDRERNRRLDDNDIAIRRGHWSARRGSLTWKASLRRPYITFKNWGQTAQNGSFIYCPSGGGPKDSTAVIINRAGRNYSAGDRNRDGIRETASGDPIVCDP